LIMPGHIEMLVISPLYLAGLRREKNTLLKVEAIVANGLLASGRAKLVNHADLVFLSEAENAHTLRLSSSASSRGRSLAQR